MNLRSNSKCMEIEIICHINGKEYTKEDIHYLESLVSEIERVNKHIAATGEVILADIDEMDLGLVDEYCQRMVLEKVFGSDQ